jgi:hypothetical protein
MLNFPRLLLAADLASPRRLSGDPWPPPPPRHSRGRSVLKELDLLARLQKRQFSLKSLHYICHFTFVVHCPVFYLERM